MMSRIYNRALSPDEVSKLSEWGPGPVGHWKMDEGSGTAINDSSGISYNLSRNDSPTWVNGKYGNALKFDGIDDGAYNSSFDNKILKQGREGGSWTLEAWAKKMGPNSLIDLTMPPIVGRGGCHSGILSYSSSYRFVMLTGVGGCYNGWAEIIYNPPVQDAWYHLSAVYNNRLMKFYVDGKLIGTETFTGVGYDYSDTIYIARMAEHSFNGLIDDVRIYNYVRTQKQILEDMNAGNPSG